MALAVDLMSVGTPAEQANMLGLSAFTLQNASQSLKATSDNLYMITSPGNTSVTFAADTPIGKVFFVSNSTSDTALLRPHPYQVSQINGQDQVSIPQFQTRIVIRLNTNRWISFITA